MDDIRAGVDDAVVVRLSGELDAGETGDTAVLLEEVQRGTSRLIVDMVDVSFIDSSVVRTLLLAQRAAEQAGGWLRLVYTHHVIARVVAICGLTDVLPQYPTIESARRGAVRAPVAVATAGDDEDGAR